MDSIKVKYVAKWKKTGHTNKTDKKMTPGNVVNVIICLLTSIILVVPNVGTILPLNHQWHRLPTKLHSGERGCKYHTWLQDLLTTHMDL